MSQVIFNADDFGLSSAVNEAIIRAFRQGILTSASLMVNGPAASEAVCLARENPRLSVGLHLVLVQGKAILPPPEISDLVDAQGNFPTDPTWAGIRYFFRPALRAQLQKEIEAQLQAFLRTGLRLDHLNGHLHFQVHPTIFSILLELLPRYSIPSFRLPREPLWATLKIDARRLLYKLSHTLIFRTLSAYCAWRARHVGLTTTCWVYGLLQTGRMTEPYLLKLLPQIHAGSAEIYFHPGFPPCAELSRWTPEYLHRQEWEALTSQRVRAMIDALGLTPISYASLRRISPQ